MTSRRPRPSGGVGPGGILPTMKLRTWLEGPDRLGRFADWLAAWIVLAIFAAFGVFLVATVVSALR